jgi:hypothetical protein
MTQPLCDKGYSSCTSSQCPIYKLNCKHTSCKQCKYFTKLGDRCKMPKGSRIGRFNQIQWNCEYFTPARKLATLPGEKGIRITVKQDRQRTEILNIKALPKDKLPKEYLHGYPHCYMEDDCLLLFGGGIPEKFGPGTINNNYLQETIIRLKACGKRLANINKQLQEDKIKQSERIITYTI